MKIKNEQVRKIYDRWDSIWRNEDIKKDVRLNAYSILKVVEAMVEVYESGSELCNEHVDDLFIKWDVGAHMPIFPEDVPKIKRRLRKALREIEDNNNKKRKGRLK